MSAELYFQRPQVQPPGVNKLLVTTHSSNRDTFTFQPQTDRLLATIETKIVFEGPVQQSEPWKHLPDIIWNVDDGLSTCLDQGEPWYQL